MSKIVIIDPGHGLGNRQKGKFDPGAVAGGRNEATIAMDYANELRAILRAKGAAVVRTRIDAFDPCHVSERAAIARRYKGDIMLSIHCNAADGKASGTETFYRGAGNRDMATRINLAACKALGTRNRGAKTEDQSQHGKLAVMNFQPCFLLELGFIDHAGDREKMLDEDKRRAVCEALAAILLG